MNTCIYTRLITIIIIAILRTYFSRENYMETKRRERKWIDDTGTYKQKYN